MADEFQKLTDRLLVEGAKFEEVIETVAERGGPRLTLGAVRDYFRRNLTLQMQRVRYQVQAAKALNGIRLIVTINLTIGLILIPIAATGRFWS